MRRVRRTALMRDSGPYEVKSLANGNMRITPSWPQFPAFTEEAGGGPGLRSRLSLAADLARWLNAPYYDAEPQSPERVR